MTRALRARHGVCIARATVVLAAACTFEDAREREVADTAAWTSDTVSGIEAASVVPPESLVAVPDRTVTDTSALALDAAAGDVAALGRRLIIPVVGVQSQDLRDTFAESRGTRPHDAIDIPAPRGTAVVSATNGKLMKLHNSVPGGLMVYAADETDSFILMYGHLDAYAAGLTEGMPLRQGQVLGYVGTTGNAPPNTPHLHFAIATGKPSESWWRGTAVNPYPLLNSSPAAPAQ